MRARRRFFVDRLIAESMPLAGLVFNTRSAVRIADRAAIDAAETLDETTDSDAHRWPAVLRIPPSAGEQPSRRSAAVPVLGQPPVAGRWVPSRSRLTSDLEALRVLANQLTTVGNDAGPRSGPLASVTVGNDAGRAA